MMTPVGWIITDEGGGGGTTPELTVTQHTAMVPILRKSRLVQRTLRAEWLILATKMPASKLPEGNGVANTGAHTWEGGQRTRKAAL